VDFNKNKYEGALTQSAAKELGTSQFGNHRSFRNGVFGCFEHQQILSFETIKVAGKELTNQVDKISKSCSVFFSPVRWVSVCLD